MSNASAHCDVSGDLLANFLRVSAHNLGLQEISKIFS